MKMRRRGERVIGDRRSERLLSLSLGALLFALSLFSHLAFAASHTAPGASHWYCENAPATGLAAEKAGKAPGSASTFDHCSDCAMLESPTLPDKGATAQFGRQPVRLVNFHRAWIEPRERRRAGETRSRAPPRFS
jgi:hypothetical protein